MVEGVDYSTDRPSPAGLAAAGKHFAARYIGPGTDDKHLTVAERNALWNHGLDVVLLVEGAAGDALQGRAMGVRHARLALDQADALGVPDDRPIYFAADKDLTPLTWPGVAQYLLGAASVVGLARVGIYGEADAMWWAARDRVARWFAQTYAWSSGIWVPHNHIEQYRNHVALAGGTVDLCRALQVDYGQWEQPMTPEEHAAVLTARAFAEACAAGADTYWAYPPAGGTRVSTPMGAYWARIAAEVATLPTTPGDGTSPAAVADELYNRLKE